MVNIVVCIEGRSEREKVKVKGREEMQWRDNGCRGVRRREREKQTRYAEEYEEKGRGPEVEVGKGQKVLKGFQPSYCTLRRVGGLAS